MTRRIELLVTDLDNTLYDWVTFYARAFEAMVKALVPILGSDEGTILNEFKLIHQRYGNSEQPFAVLELPSVQRRFGDLPRSELKVRVDPALHAFNKVRKEVLRLYDSVDATLRELVRRGVVIVGHTEAIAVNAHFRLTKLSILDVFERLYTLQGHVQPHPDPKRQSALEPPPSLIREVPKTERKPNPELLLDICGQEGFQSEVTAYVGDSIARDVSMAKAAGVSAIWARYGTKYDPGLWKILVRVTHWTDEDVRREEELKRSFSTVTPDYTLDSFHELLDLPGLSWGKCAPVSSPCTDS